MRDHPPATSGAAGETREHPPHLAHHFDTPQQQFDSGKLGMWIFLATEILFFSGLFVAYAVYRANHPEIFVYAHRFLDKTLGGINTVVLITSSFSMALGVRFAQLGERRKLIAALVVTVLCAFGFMGIKGVEYHAKWKHGLLWGQHYDPHHAEHGEHGDPGAAAGDPGEAAVQGATADSGAADGAATDGAAPAADRSNIAPAPRGPAGLAGPAAEDAHHGPTVEPDNVHIFFGIYFAMTGLHGLHVLIGIGLIVWLILRARRGEFGPRYFTPVDLVGLYWHLVDLIWIFLFPLLYLIH